MPVEPPDAKPLTEVVFKNIEFILKSTEPVILANSPVPPVKLPSSTISETLATGSKQLNPELNSPNKRSPFSTLITKLPDTRLNSRLSSGHFTGGIG